MKKVHLLIAIVSFLTVQAQQVAIGTDFPSNNSAFHVDALKNNTTQTPTATQQADDFVVLKNGNIGIGTTAPTDKLEINSQVTNASGLKLTNLTSLNAAVDPDGRTIGVDANGQIIRMTTYSGATFVPNQNSSADKVPFTIDGLDYVVIPNAVVSLTAVPSPEVGKVLFINFSTSIKFTSVAAGNSANSYYEARVFIDGVPTEAIQTYKEYMYSFYGDGVTNVQRVPGPTQFSISTVLPITVANGGSHTVDLRIKRVKNSGETNAASVSATTMSTSNSAAYINF